MKYFHEDISAYAGDEYTYKTKLPLLKGQKVFAPVADDPELKKAIVTQINVPEIGIINQPWTDRIKEIKELIK